jgi:hypothetical protein
MESQIMLLLFLLAIRSEGKINFYQRRFFFISLCLLLK